MKTHLHSMGSKILLLFTLLALAGQLQAGSYPVTTMADSGPGSLREAINSANGSIGMDTITFSVARGYQYYKPDARDY